MSLEVKSADVGKGVRLEYVEQGDPAGVPVVMLHGVTDSWRSFERVLPHLPPSVRAIAVTQRGHGASSKPDTGYRTRDFAADVAALADELGLERLIVVGHSMGSAHAIRFAIDFPDRTLGVVLLGAFATFAHNPVVTEFWDSCVSTLEDPIDPAIAREFQASTLARPIPDDFFETVVGESLKMPARVWRAAFEGMLENDFASELHRISAPTLILWAERDAFCPHDHQTALLAGIAGSQMLTYEGAGHALHWEEPERFASDVAAFALASIATAAH